MNSDNFPEYFDAMICGGGHLIHSISPTGNVTTFEDYAGTIFLATVRRFLRQCSRCDIVWDLYHVSSIKAGTRIERGTGTRHHVSASGKMPSDWNNFLRDSNNKVELFQFLSTIIQNMILIGSKFVFAALGSEVVHAGKGASMTGCYHEEAYTRIIIHLIDILNAGLTTVVIKTCDTDVIAILCGQYVRITTSQHVWIMFGSGKHERRLNLDQFDAALGPKKMCGDANISLIYRLRFNIRYPQKKESVCVCQHGDNNEWLSDALCDLSYNPFSEVNEQWETFQRLQTLLIFTQRTLQM